MADNEQARPAATAANPPERANACVLPEMYTDHPAAWFANLDAIFRSSRITRSNTKFWHAVAKIPHTMYDTYSDIQEAADDLDDPYGALKERLTKSFGMSKAQRLDAYLAHPGLGSDKPSVLIDRMFALQPDDIADVTWALIYRHLPA
jgi:hypothetical protein